MRYLYVIICGLASSLRAHAQAPAGRLAPDSVWYEATEDKRRVSSLVDSAGACTEVLRWEGPGGLVRSFYPSGHLREYAPYGDLATSRRHGIVTTWYDNGQPATWQEYREGLREGQLLVYYATGGLKRRTQYAAGNELPGSCFDEAGAPVAYYPYEQLPLYPGGFAQLTKEITRALHLPPPVGAGSLQEVRVVGIEFQVGEDGQIRASRVARSSMVPRLDRAVLATIAKLTRRFSPARRDGRLVACTYYLPVQLRVPMSLRLMEEY